MRGYTVNCGHWTQVAVGAGHEFCFYAIFFAQYGLTIDPMLSRVLKIYHKTINFSRFDLVTRICA
jgi:hypothetical protein